MAYIQILEKKILETVDVYTKTYNESPLMLLSVLKIGKEIRENGLTPFYIFNEDTQSIEVTSEENMNNKLN